MKEIKYIIQDEIGIHARPAGQLVKEAAQFEASITIKSGDKEADAKKIIRVMSLAVKQGDEITVVCDGYDEAFAMETMERFLIENL